MKIVMKSFENRVRKMASKLTVNEAKKLRSTILSPYFRFEYQVSVDRFDLGTFSFPSLKVDIEELEM